MNAICRQPLTNPTLLAARGPDAVRFLNGQLTQDVAGLGTGTRWSCVTDAKGKLQFFVSICQGRTEDEIWIAARPGVEDELHARLDRYLIADEVEIENLTGRFSLVHAEAGLEGAPHRRECRGIFGDGVDHWVEAGNELPGEILSTEAAESLRIRAAWPAWGHELETGMLPPEAGLDAWAVSYNKGCYIGQEVLSRIKSIGRVNRRLAKFQTTSPEPDELQMEGAPVGHLTSVDPIAAGDGTRHALGYIGKKAYDCREFSLSEGSSARWIGWA
jgi:folate-binding protein YgfZ